MSKRILLAVIAAVIMCSCAFGETGTDRASRAWQRTKDFFTEDIPSYCVRGAVLLRDWWNNSDSKKIDRLTEEVASLRKDIARLSEGVSASGIEDSSHSAELSAREQELDKLSNDIDSQKAALQQQARELDERRREIDAQVADLQQQAQELDKLRQDIAAQRDALQESADHAAEFTRKYQEAEGKAAKIHARLSEDEHISKFIASGMLAKIDIERFMLYDRSYGAVNIPGTPYGTLTANLDTDKFGFIDTGTLKASLKSLFRDNTLSLRGDSTVVLVREDDRANWNRQIDSVSDRAFFTLEGLTSELGSLSPAPDNSESEIAAFLKVNDQRGRLRIFFRTRHEGLYVLVLMDNEDSTPVIYLAADDSQKLINRNRRDLQRALRNRTELLNSGREAALYFDSEDSKIDVYLDRFVKDLVDKIPSYKE